MCRHFFFCLLVDSGLLGVCDFQIFCIVRRMARKLANKNIIAFDQFFCNSENRAMVELPVEGLIVFIKQRRLFPTQMSLFDDYLPNENQYCLKLLY